MGGAHDHKNLDDALPPELREPPLITGEQTDATLTQSLLDPVWQKRGRNWWRLFGIASSLAGVFVLMLAITIWKGVGMWGNNQPVSWAFDIINFVWWIGIGHAGTLISAILLLFQQGWRTSINRAAEAMTIFAVVCAGMFPLFHTGRPWFDYWLFPHPNTMEMWPQFKSPLMWDVFAISTYATVSVLFWFLGLVPDVAALRDASKSKAQRIVYGILALGWRGSARQWANYRWSYLLLAGLSTPLVLSVHTIVSFDFATGLLPGWHTTIFPPYFVAGAVYSGFAMVLTLMIPARKYLYLEHVITMKHLDNMMKIMLVTGWMVTYGYFVEGFTAWYSGSVFELGQLKTRFSGPYAPLYWLLIFCNCVVVQTFWLKRFRQNIAWMFIASLLINLGMWLERFVIVVISLHQDFMPSAWGMYYPRLVDTFLFIGTIGLFGTLFLLFLRFLPSVAMSEVKEINHEMKAGH
jgi:molybdopterin-containing oxidoreductase family membrane subunit